MNLPLRRCEWEAGRPSTACGRCGRRVNGACGPASRALRPQVEGPQPAPPDTGCTAGLGLPQAWRPPPDDWNCPLFPAIRQHRSVTVRTRTKLQRKIALFVTTWPLEPVAFRLRAGDHAQAEALAAAGKLGR